jgi:SnoaL-like domain
MQENHRNEEDLSGRDCRQVLDDHFACRERGDLDADLARNYAEDVVVLTPQGCHEGHAGVREAASLLYEAVHHQDGYKYSSIVTDDRVALLEWSAKNDEMEITDGVDSFLIEDGLIQVQTIRYTVTYSDLSQAKEASGL